MKKTIGLIFIIIVLILSAYYVMGFFAERKIKEGLSNINQSNIFTAEVSSYDRGLFSSQAVFNLTIAVPHSEAGKAKVKYKDWRIVVPATIYHGPVIFVDSKLKFGLGYANVEFTPNDLVLNDWFSNTSTMPRIAISLLVNYWGSIVFRFNVPTVKLFTINNGQLDGANIFSQTKLAANMKTINGELAIKNLQFVHKQISAKATDLISKYNLHRTGNRFYLGEGQSRLATFEVKDSDLKVLAISKFYSFSNADVKNKLFSADLNLSIEKIYANSNFYGPIEIKMYVRNLDPASLIKIREQAERGQASLLDKEQARLAIIAELPKLLGKQAEFAIKQMKLVMPEGTIEGDLFIALPKLENNNFFALLPKVQGNGKLKVPIILVKKLLSESIKNQLLHPANELINNKLPPQIANKQDNKAPPTNKTTTKGEDTTITKENITKSTQDQVIDEKTAVQQARNLTDQKLATMLNTGLIVYQGDSYYIDVNFTQGHLTINGKKFSPEMLKF